MRAQDIVFHQDGSGLSFAVSERGEEVGKFKIPFLGEYAIGTFLLAASIARSLGMSWSQIYAASSGLTQIPHRLQTIHAPGNLLIIDDSYNGNPEGFKAAVDVLACFEGRRKVFLTPGLVEMGQASSQIHQELGERLGEVADLVILVRNSSTPHLAQGLQKAGFPTDKLVWFESTAQAHAGLKNVLKSGDVIVFQNDWPEDYME